MSQSQLSELNRYHLVYKTNTLPIELSWLKVYSLNIQYLIKSGVKGFEPLECRNQNPMPYRLAIPHYSLHPDISCLDKAKMQSKKQE